MRIYALGVKSFSPKADMVDGFVHPCIKWISVWKRCAIFMLLNIMHAVAISMRPYILCFIEIVFGVAFIAHIRRMYLYKCTIYLFVYGIRIRYMWFFHVLIRFYFWFFDGFHCFLLIMQKWNECIFIHLAWKCGRAPAVRMGSMHSGSSKKAPV